jgi:histone deacetylase 1/2
MMIRDGTTLSITHTADSTTFSSLNSKFTPNNVLCVPNMTKNLISISKFCTTYNASVELLPSSFSFL